MSNYKETYISIEEFVCFQQTKRPYEGFVIGLGYAYIGSVGINPPNLNGYTHTGKIPYQLNRFALKYCQNVDSSPEMIERSMGGIRSNDRKFHVVRRGDTLTSIAQQYRVSVENLVLWNNLNDPNIIQVGQRVIVSEGMGNMMPVSNESHSSSQYSLSPSRTTHSDPYSTFDLKVSTTAEIMVDNPMISYSVSPTEYTTTNTDAWVREATTMNFEKNVLAQGGSMGFSKDTAFSTGTSLGYTVGSDMSFSVDAGQTFGDVGYGLSVGINKQGLTFQYSHMNRNGSSYKTDTWTGVDHTVTIKWYTIVVVVSMIITRRAPSSQAAPKSAPVY